MIALPIVILVRNPQLLLSFNTFNTFLRFPCLYNSVTFNGSKGKFGIVFCSVSMIENFVTPWSSPSFPMKWICWWELYIFVLINQCRWVCNSFGNMSILTSFLLHNYIFLTFRQAFHTLLVCVLWLVQKLFYCWLIH